MSEQNKMNVEAVLDTKGLYEQLNKQKYKINVEIDSASINNQLQSAINGITSNSTPAKIPLEMDVTGFEKTLSRISTDISSVKNIKGVFDSSFKSLD